MPHVDGALRGAWTARGESRFARPVAAITAAARRWTEVLAKRWPQTLARPLGMPAAPRIRQDIEVRALEETFGRAADFADFQAMERDFERREAGGVRSWDWR